MTNSRHSPGVSVASVVASIITPLALLSSLSLDFDNDIAGASERADARVSGHVMSFDPAYDDLDLNVLKVGLPDGTRFAYFFDYNPEEGIGFHRAMPNSSFEHMPKKNLTEEQREEITRSFYCYMGHLELDQGDGGEPEENIKSCRPRILELISE
jgi:hypothetical protein